MNYLHHEFDVGPDDVVEVTLDGQANVLLMDPANFDRYRRGESYRDHGGLAEHSPARLAPPQSGSLACRGRPRRVRRPRPCRRSGVPGR